VVEKTSTHIKVEFPHPRFTGCKFELSVPILFWERFNSDKEWRELMSGKYAKFIDLGFDINQLSFVPKRINWTIESGVIPEDEPFANSKYTDCPRGYEKIEETADFIKLGQQSGRQGGGGEITLIVPEIHWKRFTSDIEWRHAMNQKYAKTEWLGSYPGHIAVPEAESNKTGIIPDDL